MSKLVFNIVKNGYDPEAVDAYVDLLRYEYTKLYNLRIEAQTQKSDTESEIRKREALVLEAQAKAELELETQAARAQSMLAHAEQILAEAKKKARETEAQAILKANRIIDQAQNVCMEIGDEFREIISHMQPFMELRNESKGEGKAC